MDKTEFAICLAMLSASTGKDFTKEQAGAWYALLGDREPKALQAAIKRVLLESQYPGLPPVGRIASAYDELVNGVIETAEQAFGRVMKAVRCHGFYEPGRAREELGEIAWNGVMDCGGWERFCDCTDSDKSSLMAQYRGAYEKAVERKKTQRLLPESQRPKLQYEPSPRVIPMLKGIGQLPDVG